jgi:hypothetical protein
MKDIRNSARTPRGRWQILNDWITPEIRDCGLHKTAIALYWFLMRYLVRKGFFYAAAAYLAFVRFSLVRGGRPRRSAAAPAPPSIFALSNVLRAFGASNTFERQKCPRGGLRRRVLQALAGAFWGACAPKRWGRKSRRARFGPPCRPFMRILSGQPQNAERFAHETAAHL